MSGADVRALYGYLPRPLLHGYFKLTISCSHNVITILSIVGYRLLFKFVLIASCKLKRLSFFLTYLFILTSLYLAGCMLRNCVTDSLPNFYEFCCCYSFPFLLCIAQKRLEPTVIKSGCGSLFLSCMA